MQTVASVVAMIRKCYLSVEAMFLRAGQVPIPGAAGGDETIRYCPGSVRP
jgi:hypothetical protein